MNKNGFTLIELLAVIVILAIIALIAVPVLLNIINDSKKSSEEQTVELYMDSVKKAIARKQLEESNFNPDTCNIKDDGNLLCNDIEVIVDMKGIKPNKGIIEIKDNKLSYKNLLLKGTYFNRLAIPVQDNNNNGKPDIGDKYTYKVNKTDTFNFYVLSINSDNTVNLIMDRNICGSAIDENDINNGKLATSINKCTIAWYSGNDFNAVGPITAMQGLYNATKNWNNVPDMIMNYNDEYNTNSGYQKIITDINTKITSIIRKNGIENTIGSVGKPIKSRLPMYSEVSGIECTESYSSCPIWLIEYLSKGNMTKYALNEHIEGINGFWLLCSHENSRYAKAIGNLGHITGSATSRNTTYGIRPVITVPKSYLE